MTTNNNDQLLIGVKSFLQSIPAEYENTPEDGKERTSYERGYKECAEACLALISLLEQAGEFTITDADGTPVVDE